MKNNSTLINSLSRRHFLLGTGIHRGPFDSYKQWNTIGKALIENGFTKEDTDKILGGNFLRMFAKISL